MSDDRRRLARWLRRARPARRDLARALLTGLAASAVAVGLTTGAIGLLVASAGRPGLRSVAVVLVAIEVFAFFRSPLRLAERLAAHRLGYAAVTRWRRWLVQVVGRLDYRRWRGYASGDLLERALVDTDRLQDLWLRGAVPALTSLATLLALDVVVAVLPPLGRWVGVAAGLACVEALVVAVLMGVHRRALDADLDCRRAAGEARAALVELAGAGPALAALGRPEVVVRRWGDAAGRLARAEARRRRPVALRHAVLALAGAAALGDVAVHPATAPLWWVVAAALAVAAAELLAGFDAALAGASAVVAAAERLEEIDRPGPVGRRTPGAREELRARGLAYHEADRAVLEAVDLDVAWGRRVAIVGPSGSGKSSLVRLLAHLDRPDAGAITLGGVDLAELDEAGLRARVAYVPSEPGLARGYVRDVVALGRPVLEAGLAALADLGLDLDAAARIEGLSRGETARLALARALAGAPEIVLLDEPTAGLGEDDTARVLSALRRSGATVVVATHDPQVIGWCDEVFELREGRLDPLSR
jgi:ABC-type transport system involved in cytochrome bd biosynthesis fused ATPase/permease subunit